MAKSLINIVLDQIFNDAWKGKRGEKLTENELKLVQLLGRKGKVLRNIYIPKDNGETSEVDLVFITQKGIFVFESKNYSGWIFGDEKEQYWMAMLPNKEKHRFYNPIKQNQTHIKWLGKYLGNEIPLFSIIVFSERCELKKVNVDNPEIKVIKRDRTYATVKGIWNANPDVIDEKQVEKFYYNLKELTNVDVAVKAAHVNTIERKYKKTILKKHTSEEKTDSQDKLLEEKGDNSKSDLDGKICPKCGSKLILRTAKKGANAGNQFYGCGGFPKCRYIEEL